MILRRRDGLRLGVECCAPLAPGRRLLLGWAAVPAGAAAGLVVTAGTVACPVLHAGFHPRPDIPEAEAARGFALVLAAPAAAPLALTLEAGTERLATGLEGAETDAARAIAARDAAANLALLREAAATPALHPLLGSVFATWLARLPLIQGRGEGIATLAALEGLGSAAGEVLLAFRPGAATPPRPLLEVLPLDPGGTPLPLLGWEVLPGHLAWGRVAAPGAEWLVQLGTRRDRATLRLRPQLLPAAALLARAAQAGPDALRRLIALREAAFPPLPAPPPPLDPPSGARIAVLLGIADPWAVRLVHAAAPILEARFDRLLLDGPRAKAAAPAFRRAAVQTGLSPLPGAPALVLDPSGLAALATEEAPAPAPLPPGALARLLRLHDLAGCDTGFGDSLARLADPARPLPAAFPSPEAGALAAAHLARLWGAGPG